MASCMMIVCVADGGAGVNVWASLGPGCRGVHFQGTRVHFWVHFCPADPVLHPKIVPKYLKSHEKTNPAFGTIALKRERFQILTGVAFLFVRFCAIFVQLLL